MVFWNKLFSRLSHWPQNTCSASYPLLHSCGRCHGLIASGMGVVRQEHGEPWGVGFGTAYKASKIISSENKLSPSSDLILLTSKEKRDWENTQECKQLSLRPPGSHQTVFPPKLQILDGFLVQNSVTKYSHTWANPILSARFLEHETVALLLTGYQTWKQEAYKHWYCFQLAKKKQGRGFSRGSGCCSNWVYPSVPKHKVPISGDIIRTHIGVNTKLWYQRFCSNHFWCE